MLNPLLALAALVLGGSITYIVHLYNDLAKVKDKLREERSTNEVSNKEQEARTATAVSNSAFSRFKRLYDEYKKGRGNPPTTGN